ncbi:MAG TPA: hypothetical protein V6D20_09870, partial [Candidatus Obscuribacterales bacterium]
RTGRSLSRDADHHRLALAYTVIPSNRIREFPTILGSAENSPAFSDHFIGNLDDPSLIYNKGEYSEVHWPWQDRPNLTATASASLRYVRIEARLIILHTKSSLMHRHCSGRTGRS